LSILSARSSSAHTGPRALWSRSAGWCATSCCSRSKRWRSCPMPDFSQSAGGLTPATVIDHVLLPVADLEVSAHQMDERYGLQANPGGRHAAGGTANYIVPLGRQYLELIAVVAPDEVKNSHLGARVEQAVREGQTFVAWALRTSDLDALRAKLLD